VAKDQIGVSTKKRGPERVVPWLIHGNLCNVFDDSIQVKQINGWTLR
jgi:hypothetical protein